MTDYVGAGPGPALASPGPVCVSDTQLLELFGRDLLDSLNGVVPAEWNITEAPVGPVLAYRRRVAALAWQAAPKYRARCSHCAMPYGDGNTAPRPVGYRTRGGGGEDGIFVVCRWCWHNSAPAQRFVYAYQLVLHRWPLAGVPVDHCVRDWPPIALAHGGIPDATVPFGYRPPEDTP